MVANVFRAVAVFAAASFPVAFGLVASEKRQVVTSLLGDNKFDYIIAGGGTAGLALANRLSANINTTVAVIEAGNLYEITQPLLASTPAGDVFGVGSDPSDSNPLFDWGFVTEPQAGANGRRIHYPRGKALGGSSASNFMIYQRGTSQSYDLWAQQVGDNAYTWNNFLPFFKKSVQFTPPNTALRAPNATAQYNAGAFDATGGPLHVSYANYAGPFSSYIQGAANEIGIATTQDFNSGSLLGCQYCSSTIDPSNENRASSQETFLQAATGRPNLQVFASSLVKKIIFTNKTATAVQGTDIAGLPFTLYAKKEVIVSAGAFQSPQLLMVSGVGPAATLNQFNIPIVSELPGVGQNMIDHIFFGPTYRVKVDTFTRLANDYLYVAAEYAGDYLLQKKGPLTNPVCDFLAWEKIPTALRSNFTATTKQKLSQLDASWPELEWLSAPGYVGAFTSLPFTQPRDGYQYATILMGLVAPYSRGSVTITSADTSDKPLINPNWLTDQVDIDVALASYKRARQAFSSKFMSNVLADPVEYFPGPNVTTDAQILDTIRNTLHTIYHASATCKMGPSSDKMAVVDSHARVYGVKNLRVVDASAFPFLPPGHPQSTVYALAEKIAADIIAGN